MFLAVAGFQVLTFSTSSSWGGGTKVFPSSSCVCSRGFYGTRGNAGAPERRQWEQTWASGSSQQRGAALILHVSMQLFQRSAKGGMLRGLQLNIASWREPAVCCCFLIPCGRFGRAGVGDCRCWGGEERVPVQGGRSSCSSTFQRFLQGGEGTWVDSGGSFQRKAFQIVLNVNHHLSPH